MLFGEHAKCEAEAEYPELWQGLVGAWSPCLSPPGGTVLRELSGKGNHGTLTLMDPATDWVLSQGKGALDFDGSNDYVTFPAQTYTGDWTFVAWNNPSSLRNWSGVVGNGPPNNFTRVITDASGNIAAASSDNTVVSATASVFVANAWRMLAVMRLGSTLYYSVNGGAMAVMPGSVAGKTFIFSTIGVGYYYWLGMIGDVLLWPVAKPAHEMSQLYRLGPGGWATPRRRRWNYVTAQTAIPYWVFGRKNARLIGGGVT